MWDGMIDALFGGGSKPDTSAQEAQMAQMKKEEEAAKAQATELSQQATDKAIALKRRRLGNQSLINTSALGVRGETAS